MQETKRNSEEKQSEMQKNWQEKINLRKECNKEIVKIIDYVTDKLPEFRFWQILWFLFLDLKDDRFYEESYDSLEIIKNHLKDLYPDLYQGLLENKIIQDYD